MGTIHEARIGIVRALAASNLTSQSLAQPVKKFLSLSKSAHESSQVMRKFEAFVPQETVLAEAIQGLSTAGSRLTSADIQKGLEWFSEIEKPPRSVVVNVAKILSVHGISPEEQSEKLVNMFKQNLGFDFQGKVSLLQLFRKLESEKKYVWDIYMSLQNEGSVDSTVVTESTATVLAVNGWADRVNFVLNRRDQSKSINPETTAKFIRAMSHHPLGPEYAELVWNIVKLNTEGIKAVPIREAVIGFYLANNQFLAIRQLLEQGPITNGRLAERVLGKVKDIETFSSLFGLMKNVTTDHACAHGIELACREKSPKTLLKVLDVMYLNKQRLLYAQESRIREFAKDPKSCPSIGDKKRIIALLGMLAKISAELDQIHIS
jgi:hypothetical protein